MNEQEIDLEISKLKAAKDALKEEHKTDVEKQQRDTILQSHPFAKRVKHVFMEAISKSVAIAENEAIAETDMQLDNALEDVNAEIQGKLKAETTDKTIPIADVDNLVNMALNKPITHASHPHNTVDIASVAKAAVIIKDIADDDRQRLHRKISNVAYSAQQTMMEQVTKSFMPRIYNEPEFQRLLNADEATQNIWIQQLRKSLGLEESTVEKAANPNPQPKQDIEKRFRDMQNQQPTSGSLPVEKAFEKMLKDGVIS